MLYRKTVQLTLDPREDSTDRYGHWLRYVSVAGRDAGLVLVRHGRASEYHPRSARPEARTARCQAAQDQAREQHPLRSGATSLRVKRPVWPVGHRKCMSDQRTAAAWQNPKGTFPGQDPRTRLYLQWPVLFGREPDRDLSEERRTLLEAAINRDAGRAVALVRDYIAHTAGLLIRGVYDEPDLPSINSPPERSRSWR